MPRPSHRVRRELPFFGNAAANATNGPKFAHCSEMETTWTHWVGHAANGATPFLNERVAALTWSQLRAAAMGRSSTDLQNSSEVRRYFIWLCRLVGMQDNHAMASICRLSRRAIRWHLCQKDGPTSEQLAAGLRALGEPRFRYGVFVPLPESGNKEATLGQGRADFTVYRQ